MKQFTIKDFIEYNSPCKICGRLSKLILNYDNRPVYIDKKDKSRISYSLQKTYNPSEAKVIIFDAKTNTFLSTFDVSDKQLYFELICENHCVTITSDFIKINSGFINPLTIVREYVNLKTDISNISVITVTSFNNSSIRSFLKNDFSKMDNSTNITTPPLPISKWKTKDNLESIIKTYLAFS